jgi:hypothetical protein
MVIFAGQCKTVAGYYVCCNKANDKGAVITIDGLGIITLNKKGHGENGQAIVQLRKQFGRYFCSTDTCGGFRNWVSSDMLIREKRRGGRVRVNVFNLYTKEPVEDALVKIGLFQRRTDKQGTAVFGYMKYDTYELSIEKEEYKTLTDTITTENESETYNYAIQPTLDITPETPKEDIPKILQPIVNYVSLLVDTLIVEIQKILKRFSANIETLNEDVRDAYKLLKDIDKELNELILTLETKILNTVEKNAIKLIETILNSEVKKNERR